MKDPQSGVPGSVDEYLAKVPAEMRATLQDLRKTIRAAAPDAEEVISYRIPAFRHHGILVYYAAFSEHCSIFVGSVSTQRKFAAELRPFAAGKGTVHFTPQRPLPAALVTRIVKARVAENKARERAKHQRVAPTSKRSR
ncbi:MAG TPA: hypothetical protein HA326_01535 [Thermoplasmata archaeon]|nr:hypothetical protein [Thermoplasmata archaeon]